ncbi:MAG: nickel-dependent lactate racemase [Deltaproteobacteria bacterium]|nr:MAG: nickel-dependent lactate racemase [Deltaproteobacteria bacterium]
MYRVPFGKDHLDFELPANMSCNYLTPRWVKPVADVEKAIVEALASPINSLPLRRMTKQGAAVCIVFTDITRDSPDRLLVPALLAELEAAGVRDGDVTLICGTGLHRPSTREEKIIKLGQAVVDRYRVVDHEATNREGIKDLGKTEKGVPLSVNRIAYEADLLIATGIVEPHQYAGYSGGAKTLAIGAAGEPMIAHTHGPQMVDHPGTRLGKIEQNLFQDAIREAAQRAGLSFILNVVQDDQKRPVAIRAGEPEATFGELVKAARELYEVSIQQQYDVVVAGVGFPKDLNIYQASRAASQIFFAPTPVVKKGGVFIVPAPTPEGAGRGLGEQRFLKLMQNRVEMSNLLATLRRTGYPPGAQRAFIMAKVLEKTHVIIVGTETPEMVRRLQMIPAANMDEAFEIAASKIGRSDLDVLIVPKALLTVVVGRRG